MNQIGRIGFLLFLTLGNTNPFSQAHAEAMNSTPPDLKQRLAGLRAGRIECQASRLKNGFSLTREYEPVRFYFSAGSSARTAHLTVQDWSGRTAQVETQYRDACVTESGGEVVCRWEQEGNQISFHLSELQFPLYEGPYSNQPIRGWWTNHLDRRARFKNGGTSQYSVFVCTLHVR